MGKRLSLSDIAKELNISSTTVSLVLNGKAKERRISAALVEKILKLVEEKDYQINLLAKSLRTGKSNIIGLFVEDISNQFFASFARLIEEKAYGAGYKIIYCSTNDNTKKTKELIQIFKSRQVDGYIITPLSGIEEDIQSLMKSKLPVVLFDRYFPGFKANYVAVDNLSSTYLGVHHLVTQGYTNISFITIISDQSQMQDRMQGYKKCMSDHHLPESIAEIDRTEGAEKITDQIQQFLSVNKHIDSILFSTNFLAMRGLKSMKESGLRIPEDIAIVSFDDNEFFEIYTPTITAIAQPINLLASNVIKILLEDLSNREQQIHAYQNVTIPGTLIVRDSTPRKFS